MEERSYENHEIRSEKNCIVFGEMMNSCWFWVGGARGYRKKSKIESWAQPAWSTSLPSVCPLVIFFFPAEFVQSLRVATTEFSKKPLWSVGTSIWDGVICHSLSGLKVLCLWAFCCCCTFVYKYFLKIEFFKKNLLMICCWFFIANVKLWRFECQLLHFIQKENEGLRRCLSG